jgi:N-acetylneuraminate synthase
MGNRTKAPAPSELGNLEVARRSLVAADRIRVGDVFTKDNLAIKRPGTGRSPMEYWDMLGERSSSDYSVDEVIK